MDLGCGEDDYKFPLGDLDNKVKQSISYLVNDFELYSVPGNPGLFRCQK
jgi:hypothetical protein